VRVETAKGRVRQEDTLPDRLPLCRTGRKLLSALGENQSSSTR